VAEPVKLRPAELHATAAEIDNHADDFSVAHQAAHRRAGEAVMGSGLSAGALPEMLGAWEVDRVRSGEQFTHHADRHRTAANAFAQADHGGADRIRGMGPAL
jgi:Excreted virulence factor EspC, type VII ESX diderm